MSSKLVTFLLAYRAYWEFRLYYQYSPDRLSTCPVTIHALLHIADGIEHTGPVWSYWAFPTERYCGRLQRTIRSRRHPFVNIDNYVVASAQLSQIKIRYGLEEELSLKPTKADQIRGSFSHPACKSDLFYLFFYSSVMQIQLVSYYHHVGCQLSLRHWQPRLSSHCPRGSTSPRMSFDNILQLRTLSNGRGFVVWRVVTT
jgi:hypothetical protein